MKIAVIGSRSITYLSLGMYMPDDVTEIVSGGAKGIDTIAKEYALRRGLKYTEFLPDYDTYGRFAPLRRNDLIIDYADEIIAFWDGKSRGTKYVIDHAKKAGKRVCVVRFEHPKKFI